jgi:hypothetical protein
MLETMRERAGRALAGTPIAAPLEYGIDTVYGVLHPDLLRSGATQDEEIRDLPGDDLVAEAGWIATRAETIAAPADLVWAFVAQMGWGRGGFYAYSFFDPRHLGDARGILPRLRHPGGRRLSTGPRRDHGPWRVVRLEPGRRRSSIRSRPDRPESTRIAAAVVDRRGLRRRAGRSSDDEAARARVAFAGRAGRSAPALGPGDTASCSARCCGNPPGGARLPKRAATKAPKVAPRGRVRPQRRAPRRPVRGGSRAAAGAAASTAAELNLPLENPLEADDEAAGRRCVCAAMGAPTWPARRSSACSMLTPPTPLDHWGLAAQLFDRRALAPLPPPATPRRRPPRHRPDARPSWGVRQIRILR